MSVNNWRISEVINSIPVLEGKKLSRALMASTRVVLCAMRKADYARPRIYCYGCDVRILGGDLDVGIDNKGKCTSIDFCVDDDQEGVDVRLLMGAIFDNNGAFDIEP